MDRTQQLLAFLYQTPVAIVEIDSSGTVGMMNAVASQYLMPLTGGRRVHNLVSLLEPYLPDLERRLSDFDASSGVIYEQERLFIGDTVYRFGLRRVTAEVYMAVLADVTELTRQEERVQMAVAQEAEQRSKSEIAAGVLHDIGNAITALGTTVARSLGELDWPELGTLEKLRSFLAERSDALDTSFGKEKRDLLLSLLEELEASFSDRRGEMGERLKDMAGTLSHVSEILTIQRQYTAEGSLHGDGSVDLRRVVDDALEMQRSSFSSREVRVERTYPDEAVRVPGDRTKLVRVVMNLLRNSAEGFDRLETVPSGGRRVTVRISVGSQRADVSIEDNGPGLASEEPEAGNSSKGSSGGLGLRGVREIVEAHHGGVEILRAETGGVEARLWLPTIKENNGG